MIVVATSRLDEMFLILSRDESDHCKMLNYHAPHYRGALEHSFVRRDCKSATGLHGPINLAPKHTADLEQWKMSAGTYIYAPYLPH